MAVQYELIKIILIFRSNWQKLYILVAHWILLIGLRAMRWERLKITALGLRSYTVNDQEMCGIN